MANLLGLSTTHDSGATLLSDGDLVAAVNEERFNRTKHYGYLPFESIEYCLSEAGLAPEDLDAVAVPSEVLRTDAKLLLDGYGDTTDVSQGELSTTKKLTRRGVEAVRGFSSRDTRVPGYARTVDFPDDIPVYLLNHHEAHAATAYYCSGFDEALVVTVDGLGDRLSGSVWHARGSDMENLRQWDRTGSLGWFFGVVTQALGWWIGNGEGKTMGLGAYTDPDQGAMAALRPYLPQYEGGELVDGYEFSRPKSWEDRGTHHWTFDEADAIADVVEEYGRKTTAASAQALLEEQILEIVEPWMQETGVENLATAGGVFLNVQVNRRILDETSVSDYFIFPNAGDGGLPTGAALGAQRHVDPSFEPFELTHPYLGPDVTKDAKQRLQERQLPFEEPDDIVETCAELLADGKIIAWCQGRMEYGPRALGNRSILIDPTQDDSMDRVNKRVKFRESWRPFAPSMRAEAAGEYLTDDTYDPFMITCCPVREERQDELPAVTHVDGTTRPQMVTRDANERYWRLLSAFEERTGTPVLLNTSYNLSGEPIVCDPVDAIQTFYGCGLNALAIGDYLLRK